MVAERRLLSNMLTISTIAPDFVNRQLMIYKIFFALFCKKLTITQIKLTIIQELFRKKAVILHPISKQNHNDIRFTSHYSALRRDIDVRHAAFCMCVHTIF